MEPHTSLIPGQPAPYGRACVSCSQAKCKCIIRAGGGRCERCHRLDRDCRPALTNRRRNPRKPVPSKAARLEEKLDDLVSLIKSGAQPAATALGNSVSLPTEHSTQPDRVLEDVSLRPDRQPNGESMPRSTFDNIHHESNKTGWFPYSTKPLSPKVVPEPSLGDAEDNLTHFKTYKAKYLPFIHIPPTTTARQLHQERPFLLLSIMTISAKSSAQYYDLEVRVRRFLAEEMTVQSKKSIDLLLGLLVFIAWSNPPDKHMKNWKPFCSLFSQLAMTMVFELGLNKSSKELPGVDCLSPFDQRKYPKQSTVRTMEERRALLGCFLITSTVSSFLQKIDGLRWTPYMGECLRILDKTKECPNDEVLVQQVRLQLIVERINLGTWDEGAEPPEQNREPSPLYLQALHSQLQEVKNKLPPESQNNEIIILSHLHSTALSISELALPSILSTPTTLTFSQHKTLASLTSTIQSWFANFFLFTPTSYIGFPYPIFSQLVRFTITLYQLSTLPPPSNQSILETLNPLGTLERLIENMEQVAILARLENVGNSEKFAKIAGNLRVMRQSWVAKLRTANEAVGSSIPTPPDGNETLLGEVEMEGLDGDWLADFLQF